MTKQRKTTKDIPLDLMMDMMSILSDDQPKKVGRKRPKTIEIIETAQAILSEYNPMTVRQIYYQLVSKQVIDNNRGQYQAVSRALVDARKEGEIPWGWIEDRLRRPRAVGMWEDLSAFADSAIASYRRDVWSSQDGYVECWLEKDAFSGIFEDILRTYGVTLNVGRGYDGWDSIHNAAQRYMRKEVTVLYFGDFDPSGEDMVRSLEERLNFFWCFPKVIKCALVLDDIKQYNLPPDFTKASDTRSAAFVEKFGDLAVELDALPADVLQARLIDEVEARMDLQSLADVKEQEDTDKKRLEKALRGKP